MKNKTLLAIVVLSFMLGLSSFFCLEFYLFPMEFTFEKINRAKDFHSKFYSDFDKNGLSEEYALLYQEATEWTHIYVKNHLGNVLIDEGVEKKINYDWVFLKDIDLNGTDELVYFYQDSNKLLINVIDLQTKKYLYKDVLVFERNTNLDKDWDLVQILLEVEDYNNDGIADLVYFLNTTHALFPRSFFIFDLVQEKITARFDTQITVNEFYLLDINNDSRKEIIFTSYAAGNSEKNVKYHNYAGWFGILNEQLKPVTPIKSFGNYTSAMKAISVKVNGKINYILMQKNAKDSEYLSALYLIDSEGNITKERKFLKKKILQILENDPVKNNKFLIEFDDGLVQLWNSDLEFEENLFDTGSKGTTYRVCYNKNNKQYFFFYSTNYLIATDADYNVIARYNFEDNLNTFDFITAKKVLSSEQINFAFNNYYLLFGLENNPIYNYRIAISLMVILVVFFLLISLRFFINKILVYRVSHKVILDDKLFSLLIFSGNGKILYSNKGFNQLIGAEYISIKGKDFKLLNTEINLINLISNIITNQIDNTNLIEIYKQNFEYEVKPIIGILRCNFAYILKLRNFSQEQKQERNEIWTKSIQKIAHDIKTPLSTISLNIKTIEALLDEEESINKEKYVEDLSYINDEINRIKTLTQSFLKFVNLDTPKFMLISITEQVDKLRTNFSTYFNNGIELIIDIDDEADRLWADPLQFEEMLNILIENSIDAMKAIGKIEIKCKMAQDLSNTDNSFVEIEISDNGDGINENYLKDIFEASFTTKKEGNGLGLAILKKIVEDHNGKVKVFSRPKLGTTFSIRFPVLER